MAANEQESGKSEKSWVSRKCEQVWPWLKKVCSWLKKVWYWLMSHSLAWGTGFFGLVYVCASIYLMAVVAEMRMESTLGTKSDASLGLSFGGWETVAGLSMVAALSWFYLLFVVEQALFRKKWYLDIVTKREVCRFQEQVQVLSGNLQAELEESDKALVRLKARPSRENIKSFSKLLLVILPLPAAASEWILTHVGDGVKFIVSPTVVIVVAIAPLVVSMLGSYIVILSKDDSLLLGEMCKKYISDNKGEGGGVAAVNESGVNSGEVRSEKPSEGAESGN